MARLAVGCFDCWQILAMLFTSIPVQAKKADLLSKVLSVSSFYSVCNSQLWRTISFYSVLFYERISWNERIHFSPGANGVRSMHLSCRRESQLAQDAHLPKTNKALKWVNVIWSDRSSTSSEPAQSPNMEYSLKRDEKTNTWIMATTVSPLNLHICININNMSV